MKARSFEPTNGVLGCCAAMCLSFFACNCLRGKVTDPTPTPASPHRRFAPQSLPPRDCLEGRGVARCGRSGGSSRTERRLVADGAAARRGRSSGSSRTKQRLIADEAAARRPRATTAQAHRHKSTENHFSIHHPPFTSPPSSRRGLGGGPKSYSLSLQHHR